MSVEENQRGGIGSLDIGADVISIGPSMARGAASHGAHIGIGPANQGIADVSPSLFSPYLSCDKAALASLLARIIHEAS